MRPARFSACFQAGVTATCQSEYPLKLNSKDHTPKFIARDDHRIVPLPACCERRRLYLPVGRSEIFVVGIVLFVYKRILQRFNDTRSEGFVNL
jgi:hypothetical protein